MPTIQASVTQLDHSASLGEVRGHQITIDRPEAKGGQDKGAMGGEALLMGLGGCFMSNLLAAARARDIAISNAAYSDREFFHEADMAGFRRTVDVTMWGAFYLLRSSSQQMIRQGDGGSIVVVSSPHAFLPIARAMAYNMSKAALEHMAKTAALELA